MPVIHPKVVVLLAAYNGMQWIEEQLSSILSQSAVDISVYISVDTSTDGTAEWCQAYAEKHTQVIVLPDRGRFGGASQNFFRLIRDVDVALYDLVAFSDQDDIWHEDKLQRAAQMLQDQEVDAYSSNVMALWPDGRTQLIDKAQPQVAWDYFFEAAGPGCTYVLKRQLAEEFKASVLKNWTALQCVSLHDWYCYAFARNRGFKWYIDPVPTMHYRQHEENHFGANIGIQSLMARYHMIRNGWWFTQVSAIAKALDVNALPIIQPGCSIGRFQLLKLSMMSWRCRRKIRDKLFMCLICLIMAVVGIRDE